VALTTQTKEEMLSHEAPLPGQRTVTGGAPPLLLWLGCPDARKVLWRLKYGGANPQGIRPTPGGPFY
jgi:hypothetical protein